MQYRKKGSTRWIDYPGKKDFNRPFSTHEFRLLNKKRTKVLWPVKKKASTYKDTLKNLRRIEFFKRNRSSEPLENMEALIQRADTLLKQMRENEELVQRRLKANSSYPTYKKVFKKYSKKCKKKGGQRYKVRK